MKCARILVSGLVQGVSYRAFTYKNARELGIKGFVRNLPDGRVEVLAEGEENSIRSFIERLQKGPAAANVEDLQVNWEDYESIYDSFEILRK